MQVTKNFKFSELKITGIKSINGKRVENNPKEREIINLCKLTFYLLQPIRDLIKAPLVIQSAFRSPAVNQAVGGAPSSQHILGQAADIHCNTISKLDLFKMIGSQLDYDQLIYEVDANCLHVSYVDSGANRREIMIRDKIDGKLVYTFLTKEELKNLHHV